MLSVLAVAMASITFVATRDQAPTERRVDTATIASAEQSPSAEPTPTAAETPTPEPKPKPQVKRGEVYVEVYNNSGIRGLAAETAAKATGVGWAVVGEDNWQGLIPTTTVYFPPRLKAAGKQLALDLGIKRTAPAVGAMKLRPAHRHPHRRRPALTPRPSLTTVQPRAASAHVRRTWLG